MPGSSLSRHLESRVDPGNEVELIELGSQLLFILNTINACRGLDSQCNFFAFTYALPELIYAEREATIFITLA